MIRHKNLITMVIMLGGAVYAQVFVQLCDPCDLTPILANQVMVGKKCSLQIYSDANDLWSGGLFLSGEDREMGVLQDRGKDPNSRDWKGSHLEAAGPMAKVYAWSDSVISGFDFYTSEYSCQAGMWFLVDYLALQQGDCSIGYYDHSFSWIQPDPNISILMENIPNVDFNDDGVVDLKDFMIFASHWLEGECSGPEWCQQTDVNKDGKVGLTDLTLFAQYWLWGTSGYPYPVVTPPEPNSVEPNSVEPPVEPNTVGPSAKLNTVEPPVDPNVIFRIQDETGLQEITLNTGQSICLYLTKQTFNEDVFIICLEVNLSDPNLGWIDNTEYNSADPNNSGTAQILASPRMSFFDYYGPGYTQFEGIQFVMANIGQAISDGPVASFVYTATGPGDVVLSLVNYMSPVRLEQIVIHQIGAASSSQTQTTDPNTLAALLETIWNTSEELQGSTTEAKWNAFIEDVKSSGE
jgi:hypothetical protein